jgi:hypothetical protein
MRDDGSRHYWKHPPKRKRVRKPTLASAIKEAQKAGVTRGRITIGNVSMEFGNSQPAVNMNPWDEVLPNATH